MIDRAVRADLHCHSFYSDGVLAPSALAERARAHGVQLWALTDHDELAGIDQARQAARRLGLGFVAGVEVSVTWAHRTVHVVGLGIDETHTVLKQGLAQIRDIRTERASHIDAHLAARGITQALAGATKHVRNPNLVSRTHFARHLYEAGYVESLQAAFDRYLGDDVLGVGQTVWARLDEAVAWIRAAGGVAVLAHPGRYDLNDLQFDALLTDFRDHGGQAIEVCTGSHTQAQSRHFAQVARDYGFLASSGSDFHGPGETRLDLGGVASLPSDLEPVWTHLVCQS